MSRRRPSVIGGVEECGGGQTYDVSGTFGPTVNCARGVICTACAGGAPDQQQRGCVRAQERGTKCLNGASPLCAGSSATD